MHTSAHADEDVSVVFFNPRGYRLYPTNWSVAVGAFGAKSEVEYQNLSTLQSLKN